MERASCKRPREGSPSSSPVNSSPPSLLTLDFPALPTKTLNFSATGGPSNDVPSTNTSFARFILLAPDPTSSGPSLHAASPFLIEKSLKALIGTPQGVRRLRSGDILVECSSALQSKRLLSLKKLGNSEFFLKSSPHPTLNSCKGVIKCPSLRGMGDGDILAELKSSGVSDVKRLVIKKDGNEIRTNTFFLTFSSSIRPASLRIGFEIITVSPYFPNPLRCYNCQRLGHGSRFCRSKARCANCGSFEHVAESCSAQPCCPNCKGSHPASSKDCPQWKSEKEILKTKVVNNISYDEAKKRCKAILISSSSPSFSQIVKEHPSSVTLSKPSSSGLFSFKHSASGPSTNDLNRVSSPSFQELCTVKPIMCSISIQTDVTWINDSPEIIPSCPPSISEENDVMEDNGFFKVAPHLGSSISPPRTKGPSSKVKSSLAKSKPSASSDLDGGND